MKPSPRLVRALALASCMAPALSCKAGPDPELLDALALACEEAPVTTALARTEAEGPRPHPQAVTIEVEPERYTFGGLDEQTTLMGLLQQLDNELAGAEITAEIAGKDYAGKRVALAVAPETPAARVAEVLRALELRGYGQVEIVVGRASQALVEYPNAAVGAEVAARVEALAPEERSLALAGDLEHLFARCPAAKAAFVEVAAVDPEARCGALIESLRRELPKCSRSFDMDRLMAYVIEISAPKQRSIPVAYEVEVDFAAPEVVFPAEQSWAEWGPGWLAGQTGPFRPSLASPSAELAGLIDYQCSERRATGACLLGCLGGQAPACDRLLDGQISTEHAEAICRETGELVACGHASFIDPQRAGQWIAASEAKARAACEGGRRSACEVLRRYYGRNSPTPTFQDAAKEAEVHAKACALGGGAGCEAFAAASPDDAGLDGASSDGAASEAAPQAG